MKSSTGVRVRGAARARRRVRAALQPAPSGPLPAHPPAGAGRPPSSERASLSLSLMALVCSSSSHTLLWLREQVEHAGGSFQFPRGPPRSELCHYGQGAPPLWGRCSCGQNRGRRHLCCFWEGASTQPHTYRVIQNATSLPPVSPAPVLWVSCESPCIFAFVFFFFIVLLHGGGRASPERYVTEGTSYLRTDQATY